MDLFEYRYRKHHGLPLEPSPAEGRQIPERGFTTVIDEKTILTAPASVSVDPHETAAAPNPHFLWLGGKFVGAEQANRNNAFWATADLELGQPTVKNGPLNWLHEGRHVIGSIAEAKMVYPAAPQLTTVNSNLVTATASTTSTMILNPSAPPHIVATAGIWRWLYPDEANVVEMASEAKSLWYSMECISREVACMAEGCGKAYPYMQTVREKATLCDHMRERSAPRRFVDPVFLGGAVIVPPVRPGWAEADARVLRQASVLAEAAYEQAHRPDLSTSEWEQLMASVVTFAQI